MTIYYTNRAALVNAYYYHHKIKLTNKSKNTNLHNVIL